jgi:uncharacterized surface protein with fasciclin (FAS1) repeats
MQVALALLIPQTVQPTQTILQIVGANTNLTNISSLIKAAGCASKLTQATFFTPTDTAFAMLGQAQLQHWLDPANKAEVEQVVLYHVIPGVVLSSDIDSKKPPVVAPTLSSNTLQLQVSTFFGVFFANQAIVLTPDIGATDGAVDIVDGVLSPPKPTPPTPSMPTPSPPAPAPCTGASANLSAQECHAWQTMHDAMGATHWVGCSQNRNTPCDCSYILSPPFYPGEVHCYQGHIVEITLFHNNITGYIPTE